MLLSQERSGVSCDLRSLQTRQQMADTGQGHFCQALLGNLLNLQCIVHHLQWKKGRVQCGSLQATTCIFQRVQWGV